MIAALMAILGKTWPYLLAAGLGIAGATAVTHRFDEGTTEALQAKFSAYVAQVAEANAISEKAAATALQGQIIQRENVEANNAQVIAKLQTQVSSVNSDRDRLARGLYNTATQAGTAPGSCPVPSAPGGSGPPDASAQSGAAKVAGACADVSVEDELNADQLDGLLAELSKQMKVTQ